MNFNFLYLLSPKHGNIVVQLLSHVWLCNSWDYSTPGSSVITVSQSLSDSCSVSQWCYLTLLALNVGKIVLGTNCSGVNEMMLLKVSMFILKDKHIECFESLKWLKINVCQFSFSNKLNHLGICWEILPQGLNTKQKSHWNTWLGECDGHLCHYKGVLITSSSVASCAQGYRKKEMRSQTLCLHFRAKSLGQQGDQTSQS